MTPITEEALERAGWRLDSLSASKLLPPLDDISAIIDMRFFAHEVDGKTVWYLSLCQGVPDDVNVPDDHVELTCGRFETMEAVERLIVALRGDAEVPR